jgi:hypothetical protein
MIVFSVVTPCELAGSTDVSGSMFLRNVGTHLQVHNALHPRKRAPTFSPRENLKSHMDLIHKPKPVGTENFGLKAIYLADSMIMW